MIDTRDLSCTKVEQLSYVSEAIIVMFRVTAKMLQRSGCQDDDGDWHNALASKCAPSNLLLS